MLVVRTWKQEDHVKRWCVFTLLAGALVVATGQERPAAEPAPITVDYPAEGDDLNARIAGYEARVPAVKR